MRKPSGKIKAWLEYHPKGGTFASENNSDERNRQNEALIFLLAFCINTTHQSVIKNTLEKYFSGIKKQGNSNASGRPLAQNKNYKSTF